MDLKTTKKVKYALAVLAVVLTLLIGVSGSMVLFGLLVAVFVALFVIQLRYWRCPCCEQMLGRDVTRYCTHCGKELDL